MKTIEMSMQQARHLLISLESSGKAMQHTELRRFEKRIAGPLFETIEDYDSEIAIIAKRYNDPHQRAERDSLLETLNETDGAERLTFDFEDADYEWLVQLWNGLSFSPDRFARKMVLGIGDALDNVIEPNDDHRQTEKSKTEAATR